MSHFIPGGPGGPENHGFTAPEGVTIRAVHPVKAPASPLPTSPYRPLPQQGRTLVLVLALGVMAAAVSGILSWALGWWPAATLLGAAALAAGLALLVAFGTQVRRGIGIAVVGALLGSLSLLLGAAFWAWGDTVETALGLRPPEVQSPLPTAPPGGTTGPETPKASQPTVARLRPDAVSASAQANDSVDGAGNVVTFAPGNAFDGDPTTAWRVPGSGVEHRIVARWSSAQRIVRIEVVPGYAKVDPVDRADRFLENRRIVRAAFVFSDGSSRQVTFNPGNRQAQYIDVNVVTTSVTMQILETTSGAARNYAAVSEITVWGTPS